MGIRWDGLPVVIIGTGGQSIETLNIIQKINRTNSAKMYNFIGFVHENEQFIGKKIADHFVVACDNNFTTFCIKFDKLGVIIPNGIPKVKKKIFNKITSLNITNIVYPNIIHPSVIFYEPDVKIGMGNIIAEGVCLTCEIEIGNFNLINFNATIGHNAVVKDFCVVNPLSSISGYVILEGENLIGTGANILEKITIGKHAIVGGGALVNKNVETDVTVVGIPAKVLKK
jgi:sugar O-acyltransferase (sialic acid O-acetyltransferase NeuD family)